MSERHRHASEKNEAKNTFIREAFNKQRQEHVLRHCERHIERMNEQKSSRGIPPTASTPSAISHEPLHENGNSSIYSVSWNRQCFRKQLQVLVVIVLNTSDELAAPMTRDTVNGQVRLDL